MNALMEAPAQTARPTSAEPGYLPGGRLLALPLGRPGPRLLDSEQGAISAALRCKRLSILHLAAAALDRQ